MVEELEVIATSLLTSLMVGSSPAFRAGSTLRAARSAGSTASVRVDLRNILGTVKLTM
jgi:hypothetical protein